MELIRRINKKYRRAVKIMQDLEGFRIRVGRFKDAETRDEGPRHVWLTNELEVDRARTIPDYHGDLMDQRGQMCTSTMATSPYR
jgi:pyruvate kinase